MNINDRFDEFFKKYFEGFESARYNRHPYFYYVVYKHSDQGNSTGESTERRSISDKIKVLEADLKKFEAEQDFMKCAEIRDKIVDLKKNHLQYDDQIKEIDEKLEEAVAKQDYEKAADLKKEKDEIMKKIE